MGADDSGGPELWRFAFLAVSCMLQSPCAAVPFMSYVVRMEMLVHFYKRSLAHRVYLHACLCDQLGTAVRVVHSGLALLRALLLTLLPLVGQWRLAHCTVAI